MGDQEDRVGPGGDHVGPEEDAGPVEMMCVGPEGFCRTTRFALCVEVSEKRVSARERRSREKEAAQKRRAHDSLYVGPEDDAGPVEMMCTGPKGLCRTTRFDLCVKVSERRVSARDKRGENRGEKRNPLRRARLMIRFMQDPGMMQDQ